MYFKWDNSAFWCRLVPILLNEHIAANSSDNYYLGTNFVWSHFGGDIFFNFIPAIMALFLGLNNNCRDWLL